MKRRSFFAICLLVLSVCPGASVLAGPSTEQDVSVAIVVYDDGSASETGDASAGPWVDGGVDQYRLSVTNHGSETQMIRFAYSVGATPAGYGEVGPWTIRIKQIGFEDSSNMECSAEGGFCDVVLGADASKGLSLWVASEAPGKTWVETKVIDTEYPDPDHSNDIEVERRRSLCSVSGSKDDDVLEGTDASEWICGGPGDDVIHPGKRDDVFGGDGDDLLVADKFNQRMWGGYGFDTVSFASGQGPIVLDWQSNPPGSVQGSGGDNVANVEGFIGSKGDDYFKGTNESDTFWGGAGDDSFWGFAGNDKAFGGRGDDRFRVTGHGTDSVWGGPGDDRAAVDRTDSTVSAVRAKSVTLSRP